MGRPPPARARWPALAPTAGLSVPGLGAPSIGSRPLAAVEAGAAPATKPHKRRLVDARDIALQPSERQQMLLGNARRARDDPRPNRRDMNGLQRIGAWPAVRTRPARLRSSFARLPGLVADGRDMGSVVFPDAGLKVFLTASTGERAERRHKQLISKGISANIDSIRADFEARDARDRNRSASPLDAGRRRALAGQLEPVDRSLGRSGAPPGKSAGLSTDAKV